MKNKSKNNEIFIFRLKKIFKLDELNNDPNVHGIIVQMPLDCENKIDSDLVTDYVSPEKDVDGFVDFHIIYYFTLILLLFHISCKYFTYKNTDCTQ